jgi:hypothetical protein
MRDGGAMNADADEANSSRRFAANDDDTMVDRYDTTNTHIYSSQVVLGVSDAITCTNTLLS